MICSSTTLVCCSPCAPLPPHYYYDLTTHLSHTNATQYSTDSNKWIQPQIAGTVPDARYSHSATALFAQGKDTAQIVVFGGHDGTRYLNDLLILELGTIITHHPLPRLLLINILDTVSLGEPHRWHSVYDVQGKIPEVRAGHSAVEWENKIVIFGGKNERRHVLTT